MGFSGIIHLWGRAPISHYWISPSLATRHLSGKRFMGTKRKSGFPPCTFFHSTYVLHEREIGVLFEESFRYVQIAWLAPSSFLSWRSSKNWLVEQDDGNEFYIWFNSLESLLKFRVVSYIMKLGYKSIEHSASPGSTVIINSRRRLGIYASPLMHEIKSKIRNREIAYPKELLFLLTASP